jgi:hypothetical protein
VAHLLPFAPFWRRELTGMLRRGDVAETLHEHPWGRGRIMSTYSAVVFIVLCVVVVVGSFWVLFGTHPRVPR